MYDRRPRLSLPAARRWTGEGAAVDRRGRLSYTAGTWNDLGLLATRLKKA